MIVKYNLETDLMYIHFATGIPNVLVPTDNGNISKFISKKQKNIIGYEIEEASTVIEHFLSNYDLNRKQKLAVILSFLREKKKKSQKEFSTIISISEGSYKSLERAEHNIGFDTLDKIYNIFPADKMLSKLF